MKIIPKRRRQEGKTDYKARLAILKSGKPRLVVRRTNRYIIAQLVESELAQDKVIATANSKELLVLGWPKESAGSLKNLAAAYLTGILIGKKASAKKISEAILDIGLHRNVKSSRIYATLKGALEAGLNIPHNEEALPANEFIRRKNSEIIDKIREKIKGIF